MDKLQDLLENPQKNRPLSISLPPERLTNEQFELTCKSLAKAEQIFYRVLCGELSYRPRRRVSNPLFEKYAEEGSRLLFQLQTFEDSYNGDDASEEENFRYVEIEPDKLALIYVLHLYANRVIASKSRRILEAIKEGEGSLQEILPQVFYNYGAEFSRHRKKDALKERRCSRLRDFILKEFSEWMIQQSSPARAFKEALIFVVSGGRKTQWLKQWYAEYRKQKIWNKYAWEVGGEELPDEPWHKYIYSHGKQRIAIAKEYGFFDSKSFREFFKKHKNTIEFRKGFIKLLVKQIWPGMADNEIIEQLKNELEENSTRKIER